MSHSATCERTARELLTWAADQSDPLVARGNLKKSRLARYPAELHAIHTLLDS
jgi:hypothetical protein